MASVPNRRVLDQQAAAHDTGNAITSRISGGELGRERVVFTAGERRPTLSGNVSEAGFRQRGLCIGGTGTAACHASSETETGDETDCAQAAGKIRHGVTSNVIEVYNVEGVAPVDFGLEFLDVSVHVNQ